MKVYTRVVIDMETMQTLEEESFEYAGPIAECKGGGAGGGNPSGGTTYPEHMIALHKQWLGYGNSTVAKSVVTLMNTAMEGASPFNNFEVVDVDDVFLGKNIAVSSFTSPFARLSDLGCYSIEEKYDEYLSDDEHEIREALEAESRLLDDEIFQKQLPHFQTAMDDINAVQSSPFILGEAIIWDGKNKVMGKVGAELRAGRLNARAEIALKRIGAYVEWSRLVTTASTELARLYIAARHEIDGLDIELRTKDKLFDMTVYQYGVNVMSSITGSAVSNPDLSPGKSGMGGPLSAALAGASVGAMIPGATPVTAGAGAAIGIAAYYMS